MNNCRNVKRIESFPVLSYDIQGKLGVRTRQKKGERQYVQALYFDLDGTLLNTLTALTYATNLTLRSFGLGEITIEDTKHMVGDGYKTQMERALCHFGHENMKYYDQSLSEYMKNFSANCMRGVKPYDGILHLLSFIRENHIKMAVFSNKPHEQAVENIETVFGKNTFDMILGQREGIAKKPSPDELFLSVRSSR